MIKDSSAEALHEIIIHKDNKASDLEKGNMQELWERFNIAANEISSSLGRTKNIVGEYAEKLVAKAINGTILPTSNKCADIEANFKTYQVKARKNLTEKIIGTQLSVFRNWTFDILIVVIFDKNGRILKGYQISSQIAQEMSRPSKYQNGDIIIINDRFIKAATDITDILNNTKL